MINYSWFGGAHRPCAWLVTL